MKGKLNQISQDISSDKILVHDIRFVVIKMLGDCVVAMTWCILKLWMEEIKGNC